MPIKDSRIDAYINRSAPFARPILHHLRQVVHRACPEVEETIKWSFPHFEYKGMLCSMAAFKAHCAFGFWKAALLKDPYNYLSPPESPSMGHLGRITSLADLPRDEHLLAYLQEAMELNERGVRSPASKRNSSKTPRVLEVPAAITSALVGNEKARRTFEGFSYSHKKEYVEWILEAKTESTRNRRLATMLEWLQEGKPRHWKYVKR